MSSVLNTAGHSFFTFSRQHNCTLQCKQFVACPNQATSLSLPSHTIVSIYRSTPFPVGPKPLQNTESRAQALRNAFPISKSRVEKYFRWFSLLIR